MPCGWEYEPRRNQTMHVNTELTSIIAGTQMTILHSVAESAHINVSGVGIVGGDEGRKCAITAPVQTCTVVRTVQHRPINASITIQGMLMAPMISALLVFELNVLLDMVFELTEHRQAMHGGSYATHVQVAEVWGGHEHMCCTVRGERTYTSGIPILSGNDE